MIGTDLFPTVLGICGVKPPADRVIDGADVLPLLTGKAASRGPQGAAVLAARTWPRTTCTWRCGDGDWKILAAQDFSKVELYNLKTDPKETTDLQRQGTRAARRDDASA